MGLRSGVLGETLVCVSDIRGHVPLGEAAATFCFDSGMTGPYSLRNLDLMAETVAKLCPIYLGSSADETIRALTEHDLRGGRFAGRDRPSPEPDAEN